MVEGVSVIVGTIGTVVAGIILYEYKRRRDNRNNPSETEVSTEDDWWWTRVSKMVTRAKMLDGSMVRIQGELRGIAREAKELSATPPAEADHSLVEQLEELAKLVDEAEQDVTENQLQDYGYSMSRDEAVDKIDEVKNIAEKIEERVNNE